MTKVDIISGFLGAGKTTFMKKLVAEAYQGEKVVIVENEFGEIGIDSGFLKDTGIEVSEINGGCVCCTLVGDFTTNLHEVIKTYHPDRILVEPSGVAKLSDVMVSVMEVAKEEEGIEMGALVTVINALKASKQMKAFGEFFVDQIEHATTVVLSRTQKAKDEQVEYCTKEVQEHNPKAVVITTPWEELSGETLRKAIEGKDSLEVQALAELHHAQEEAEHHHDHDHDHEHHHDHDHDHEHHHDHDHDHEHHHDHDHDHEHHDHDHGPDCTCGCHDHEHHHHHHADDVFVTWGKETPHKFNKETIENALKAFADTQDYGYVVRSKGIVPSEDGEWIYFDLVDGEYEIRTGEPDVIGRLVVIGTDVKEEDVEKLFGLN
jgi:G3E family GTPase